MKPCSPAGRRIRAERHTAPQTAPRRLDAMSVGRPARDPVSVPPWTADGQRRSWTGLAPGVAGMLRSSRSSLRRDVTAGLAMTALSIPHGMAYAELAGLPPVNGLYTTVLALAVYAVVGPSRILMTGPDSSLAPLIAAAIALVGADGDPGRAVGVAGLLALLTGAVCILAGVARLGTLAELLSRPVRVGFLNGLAVVMIVESAPDVARHDLPRRDDRGPVRGLRRGCRRRTRRFDHPGTRTGLPRPPRRPPPVVVPPAGCVRRGGGGDGDDAGPRSRRTRGERGRRGAQRIAPTRPAVHRRRRRRHTGALVNRDRGPGPQRLDAAVEVDGRGR